MPTKPKPFKTFSKPKKERWSKNNDTFYHTTRWRKKRIEILKRDPLCVVCLEAGKTTLSVVVDHDKPVSQGGAIWDNSNLKGMCTPCHNSKSSNESKKHK